MAEVFDFTKKLGSKRRLEFAKLLISLSNKVGMKLSSRGWCYIMEQARLINKNQFDRISDAINNLRRDGLIPVDFVAEESARGFKGVETEYWGTVDDVIEWMTRDVLEGGKYFTPDWWANEDYYIQVVVEKIDLVTLFEPICRLFHIPIANSKGWSSILQRAEYARRFKEAEDNGLQCVLLYCGDHDPDGLRISDTLRANLEQVSGIAWGDGEKGYDPENLIIDRFGLNYDFIEANGFTWIDNLITGSGGNLASEKHPNHNLSYVQDYLRQVGERKCEANAVVTLPRVAQAMMRTAIEKYLGRDAVRRFEDVQAGRKQEYDERLKEIGLFDIITDFKRSREEGDNDEADDYGDDDE